MNTDINIEVNEFLKEVRLNLITEENIKKYFKDINVTNEYGGLLHAAVQNKFPEDKTLKFIYTLLQCGVDVNLKGRSTGYSFIHLALYGYTENGKDYSYSTEFIIKLISLAKKYNFDVNIKDNDGDSLIHTALASEVYTGDTTVLIDTLGGEYDVLCKDNNGNNIYEALITYKKEAEQDKNKIWYDRLSKEEEIIKSYIEKNNKTVKVVTTKKDQKNDMSNQENKFYEEFNNLKTSIETLIHNITLEYLLENYIMILNKKSLLTTYLKKQDLNIKEKNSIKLLANKLDSLLKEVINNYLNVIIENQNMKNVERLKNILTEFGYENELQILKIILESSKEQEITLNDLNSLKEETKLITNEDIKIKLLEGLNKKEILFIEKIESIKEKISLINNIKGMNIIKENEEEIEIFDALHYTNITIDEINILIIKLDKLIEKNKSAFLETINTKIVELLKLASEGTNSGLLLDEEIWNYIDSKLNNKKQIKKVKVSKNGRK